MTVKDIARHVPKDAMQKFSRVRSLLVTHSVALGLNTLNVFKCSEKQDQETNDLGQVVHGYYDSYRLENLLPSRERTHGYISLPLTPHVLYHTCTFGISEKARHTWIYRIRSCHVVAHRIAERRSDVKWREPQLANEPMWRESSIVISSDS